MTKQQFIGQCIVEMLSDDISIRFNKRVYASKHAYSYFSSEPKELIINYFNGEDINDWFMDFIHEYSHYLQFKEEFTKWEPYDKYIVIFNNYLEGKRKKVSLNVIRKIQEVESDGGLKTARLIKSHKLSVRQKEYFQKNNWYIICHEFMAKNRVFFIPNSKEAISLMPAHPISMDEIENFPHIEKLSDIYNKFWLEYNK